ncbi:uncharacterized protein I206_102287 [Kwoniella pini CBS 10737]|uniref:Aminoglycoside phosphotransferase domain-containing protein n=1 Tax=Kwoniella pini CBS 10737 TaxID=1296096 RepID=A0A1B9HT23_9TREE|nr:uncharacterized protein I206_07657 [Kwoniella pini CBS 10737]OCF46423.1 hypothetical protein I206_07657 [Kwoniella pini CBS 10737]
MPELFEYPCHEPGCLSPALGWTDKCELCYAVWCSNHNTKENHPCIALYDLDDLQEYHDRSVDIKLTARKNKITRVIQQVATNKEILLSDLKSLRPDHQPSLTIPDYESLEESDWFGGFNVHFLVIFEDGVKWVLRVRQSDQAPIPNEVINDILLSEVSTLNYLSKHNIPVPKAWLPRYLRENEEDIHRPPFPFAYFFCEFLTGKPVHAHELTSLPEKKMIDFANEFCKLQIAISNIPLPFKKIGSLLPERTKSGELRLGPIFNRGTFMKVSSPYFFGPFKTNKERYLAHIDATLEYITKGALLKSRIIQDYLWHLELRELVEASSILDQPPEAVFFKHADERGDHLLMNDKGHIVGVLDWEWSYITTKEEAFAAPFNFGKDTVFRREGDNSIRPLEQHLIRAYENLGRPDLGDCVKNGKLYSRLSMIGYYSGIWDKKGFREVFGKDTPADLQPPDKEYDRVVYFMKRYQSKIGLQKLLKQENWTLEKAEEQAKRAKVEDGKEEENEARLREEDRLKREKKEEQYRLLMEEVDRISGVNSDSVSDVDL